MAKKMEKHPHKLSAGAVLTGTRLVMPAEHTSTEGSRVGKYYIVL